MRSPKLTYFSDLSRLPNWGGRSKFCQRGRKRKESEVVWEKGEAGIICKETVTQCMCSANSRVLYTKSRIHGGGGGVDADSKSRRVARGRERIIMGICDWVG